MSELKPCPWCSRVPDISIPGTFRNTDGTKWGALHCCCVGPDVRTGYRSVEHWRDLAIEAWNDRAPSDARAAALEAVTAYEAAISEAETILGSEYGTHYGPLFDLISKAQELGRALIGQPQGDAGASQ